MKQYKSIEYIMHIYLYTCLKRLTKVRHITIENLVFVTIARSESTGPGGGRNSQSEEKPLKKVKYIRVATCQNFYTFTNQSMTRSLFQHSRRKREFRSFNLRLWDENKNWDSKQCSGEFLRMQFLIVSWLISFKKSSIWGRWGIITHISKVFFITHQGHISQVSAND